MLGESNTITANLEKYNEEPTHKYTGLSTCVLKPKSTEEISNILTYCNARKLAVVVQGGHRNLVGGAAAIFDEIVINMERMNKIHELSQYTGIIKLQAGTIIQEAQEYSNSKGYVLPIDLATRESSQVGGALSLNATGSSSLKYGSLRGNVVGLRVVLANGQVLDTLDAHRKDNTGYDLKQLFIGSEGTLGIITDAAILCYSAPKAKSLCLLSMPTFEDVKAVSINVMVWLMK